MPLVESESGPRHFAYGNNSTKLGMAAVLLGLFFMLVVWPVWKRSPGWFPGVFEASVRSDVNQIRVIPFYDRQKRRKLKMFSFAQKNASPIYFSRSGSIFFTEKIEAFPVLLEVVRAQVARRGIGVTGGELKESGSKLD
jgi:hypothetical protein